MDKHIILLYNEICAMRRSQGAGLVPNFWYIRANSITRKLSFIYILYTTVLPPLVVGISQLYIYIYRSTRRSNWGRDDSSTATYNIMRTKYTYITQVETQRKKEHRRTFIYMLACWIHIMMISLYTTVVVCFRYSLLKYQINLIL